MSPRPATSGVPSPSVQPQGLRILIVDDHAIVRDGLRQLLAGHFHPLDVGEAANGKEALASLEKTDWDVVLLDLTLPGQSGLDILKQAKNVRPQSRVLVLTMHPESHYALRVLKAGASGYITKETAGAELVAAVQKVLAGGKYISGQLAETLASSLDRPPDKAPHELLSDREFNVMRRIAMGSTLKEIAFDLGLSIKTVSTYRTRIFEKLNFQTNADLTRYALEEKLIQ